jgi:hypothetical protein
VTPGVRLLILSLSDALVMAFALLVLLYLSRPISLGTRKASGMIS